MPQNHLLHFPRGVRGQLGGGGAFGRDVGAGGGDIGDELLLDREGRVRKLEVPDNVLPAQTSGADCIFNASSSAFTRAMSLGRRRTLAWLFISSRNTRAG